MSPEAGVIEHVFVLVFAVAYPVLGFFSFRRLLRRIAAGSPADRPRLYRHTIVGHWILLGTGLYLWWSAGRPLEELGFTTETGLGFMTALALTVTGIVFLLGQVRSATGGDREFLDAVADAFGPLVHLLPRSRRELRTFYLVGITAGIAEEVLWRGYLLAYLSTWLPVPVSAAIVVAGFGLAHAYQGARSVPRVTVVGAVFTGLYLLSGSLWLPILLHAAVDVLQGRMAFEVIQRRKVYSESGVDPAANGKSGSP